MSKAACLSFYIVARHMDLVMNFSLERKLSLVVMVSPCTGWQGAIMDMGTWNIEREGRVCVTVHWLLCSNCCVYSYPAKPPMDQVSCWGRACPSSILQPHQRAPSAVSSHPDWLCSSSFACWALVSGICNRNAFWISGEINFVYTQLQWDNASKNSLKIIKHCITWGLVRLTDVLKSIHNVVAYVCLYISVSLFLIYSHFSCVCCTLSSLPLE